MQESGKPWTFHLTVNIKSFSTSKAKHEFLIHFVVGGVQYSSVKKKACFLLGHVPY